MVGDGISRTSGWRGDLTDFGLGRPFGVVLVLVLVVFVGVGEGKGMRNPGVSTYIR